jgi:hypothetical protein
MEALRAIIENALGVEQKIPELRKTRKQLRKLINELIWQHEERREQK